VPSFDANIRKLVYSLWRLLNYSSIMNIKTLNNDKMSIKVTSNGEINIAYTTSY